MVKSGEMSLEEFNGRRAGHGPFRGKLYDHGHGLDHGVGMAEALGMTLSGNAAIPAVDARRRVISQLTGRRIVEMVKEDLKPSDITDQGGIRERDPRHGAVAARPMR